MFASILLCFVAGLSTAASLNVCRLNENERVTCPDDFYCCGTDQCCKLTFSKQDEESSRELFEDWVAAFCIRTVIVMVFMVILLIIGKSLQHCRKRYLANRCSEESNLPKYIQLEKESLASDFGNISVLIGTPFYEVDSSRAEGYKGSSIVPMAIIGGKAIVLVDKKT